MTVFERIQKLAKQRGVAMGKLALSLGFSENLFYRWKTSEPKAVDLEKVADYFDVSVDYLLGREHNNGGELDLDKMLDEAVSYSGKPMSKHDKEVIRAFLIGKFSD